MLQCQASFPASSLSGTVVVAIPLSQIEYDDCKKYVEKKIDGVCKEDYPLIIEGSKKVLLDLFKVPKQFTKKGYEKSREDSRQCYFNFIILLHLKDNEVKVTYYPDLTFESYEKSMKVESKLCRLCQKSGKKRCSGCGWALYCSVECQKSHWKEHKKMCCGAKKSAVI
jgi:hypothetical protein